MFDATAIILAGGMSSRMGQNKSLMKYNDVPMIEYIYNQLKDRFNEILIGANNANLYEYLNLKVVEDKITSRGPLMGILSCLEKSENDLNFITACDIPEINIKFVEKMLLESEGYDIIMPVTGADKYEPLFAVYRKSVIKPAEKILNSGKSRIIELFKYLNVKFIQLPENDWYFNINTIDDYHSVMTPKEVAPVLRSRNAN